MGQLHSHEHVQAPLLSIGDIAFGLSDDPLHVAGIRMIGHRNGLVPHHRCPSGQLDGQQLPVAVQGVHVKIYPHFRLPPLCLSLSIMKTSSKGSSRYS